MPTVRDRVDRQEDMMQTPFDTAAVMNVLEETMDEKPAPEMDITPENLG